MRTADEQTDIVIITGLSGAGRSTAAKALEDLGWYVVDNLPPTLLPTMVDLAVRTNGAVSRMAAVIDFRSLAFSTDLKSAVSELAARGCGPAAQDVSHPDAHLLGARLRGLDRQGGVAALRLQQFSFGHEYGL